MLTACSVLSLRNALTDAGTFLLFDRQVAGLIRTTSTETPSPSRISRPCNGASRGSPPGFSPDSPTLRQAPIAEILDFREDVGAEVAAYRAATAEMASIIAEPAHSEDFEAVVNNRWINEVQLALREIEDRARQVGLLQRMGDVASASGLQLGGLLAGAFTAASVAGWAAAAPAVAAAGAMYAWDVHRASAATRDELRGHRFILLHDVGEQLAS